MRLPIPVGLSEWWDSTLPDGSLQVSLTWRGDKQMSVGTLQRDRMLLHFSPNPADLTGHGAEHVGRMLGKAFTRAGWRRPELDPTAMFRLLDLRRGSERLEFILDTNALVEGVAHWLVDHFADRCDLVITAVTLRELQDAHQIAAFSERLPKRNGEGMGKMMGARQLYLSAHRLRERTSYQRVLWRELEVDDTALLLSRGNSKNGKTSESDTLLLRAVRRSIHDRVNNLERFFVTGDTALARRATTELPAGSVIAARVLAVEKGEVLFPCSWWPGADQGLRVVRHPSRLVWELLCVGDDVVLTHESGREWTFCAFMDPMWPTDYMDPWVEVIETGKVQQAETEAVDGDSGDGQPPSSGLPVDPPEFLSPFIEPAKFIEPAEPDPGELAPAPATDFWGQPPGEVSSLDDNLRLPSRASLDLLEVLALTSDPEVAVPTSVFATSVSKHHVRLFLETLGLATADEAVATLTPGPRREALEFSWRANNLDGVFDQVRGWAALEEWATLADPPSRPRNTEQAARALAALLGQGAYHPETRKWVRGGCRPDVARMKAAVRAAVPCEGGQALSVYRLLVEVFLTQLGVSPSRVIARWDDLWTAQVFEGFEPREGGSSSGRFYQEVADLGPTSWSIKRLDLESLAGTRDIVFKGAL